MKILFYIEPRIEMGRPYMREWWLKPFSLDLINALKRSDMAVEFEYCIALNEALHYKYPDIDRVKRKVFSQRELLPPEYKDSVLAMSVEWLNATYSKDLMSYYANMMQNRFSDFIPDVIVTFTPVPFFKKIFPEALILHHEVSLFSRTPYPQTWYLDPSGLMFADESFLNKFKDQLQKIDLTCQQSEIVDCFKQRCQKFYYDTSPFDEIMLSIKEKFEYLAFVPLGHSESCSYYSGREYKFTSQYEFLQHILDNVPENTGVIATTHPDFHHILPEEAREFLKLKYPNFIHHDAFEKYYASSQYILAYSDVVIGIYSSLCFQALPLDKRVINLGSLHVIADSSDLRDISAVCKEKPRNKDNILYWILTRYAVQKEYLYDPEWFAAFLVRSLNRYRSEGVTSGFYDLIDSEDSIFEKLISRLDERGPSPHGRMPYEVLLRSYHDLRAKYDELYSKDVFIPLDEMIKSGEELFAGGKLDEAYNFFTGMLGRINKLKGELMNNIAVVHAHGGRLDQAEKFLNYLIKEGYESRDAVRNLELVKKLREQEMS